jgi:hypothetical protein
MLPLTLYLAEVRFFDRIEWQHAACDYIYVLHRRKVIDVTALSRSILYVGHTLAPLVSEGPPVKPPKTAKNYSVVFGGPKWFYQL